MNDDIREYQQPREPDPLFAALEAVEDHADPLWKDVVADAIWHLVLTADTWTSDDVYDLLPKDAHTHEPRAMGAIIRRFASAGWIVSTNEYRESRRPEAHRNPKKVWRSNPGEAAPVRRPL